MVNISMDLWKIPYLGFKYREESECTFFKSISGEFLEYMTLDVSELEMLFFHIYIYIFEVHLSAQILTFRLIDNMELYMKFSGKAEKKPFAFCGLMDAQCLIGCIW